MEVLRCRRSTTAIRPSSATTAAPSLLRSETLLAIASSTSSRISIGTGSVDLCCNNNGGNLPASGEAAFLLQESLGVTVMELYPWGLGYQLVRDLYEDPDRSYGHGGEPEMSAMMAMFPERIVAERIPEGGLVPTTGGPAPGELHSLRGARTPGWATVFWQWDSVCPTGASGVTTEGVRRAWPAVGRACGHVLH